MIPLLAFYIYLAWKQARANDVLIDQLAGDAALAKTHHRKAWPFKPGWAKEVHVWPFLLRIEFLAAIIVTIISWSGLLAECAPRRTGQSQPHHEPAKAPWYSWASRRCSSTSTPGSPAWSMPTLIILASW